MSMRGKYRLAGTVMGPVFVLVIVLLGDLPPISSALQWVTLFVSAALLGFWAGDLPFVLEKVVVRASSGETCESDGELNAQISDQSQQSDKPVEPESALTNPADPSATDPSFGDGSIQHVEEVCKVNGSEAGEYVDRFAREGRSSFDLYGNPASFDVPFTDDVPVGFTAPSREPVYLDPSGQRTPTRSEIFTALVTYRALGGASTRPPKLYEIATAVQTQQYADEAERGLVALENAAIRSARPVERAWTAEELDSLPPYSIVGVSSGPVGDEWQPKYEVWQHEGHGQWLHLDPTDRDDGEALEPSGHLIHRSTRYGKCPSRVIAMYVPEEK